MCGDLLIICLRALRVVEIDLTSYSVKTTMARCWRTALREPKWGINNTTWNVALNDRLACMTFVIGDSELLLLVEWKTGKSVLIKTVSNRPWQSAS